MKKNVDYIMDFNNAYKAMKDHATEVIKNYGKTLEVEEILKSRLMKEKGWTEWPVYGSEAADSIENEVEEWKYDKMYWCSFEGKHEQIYCGYISMVRWNTEREEIEIYFDSNDGYVSEWLPESYIGFEREAIYLTILEFID